MKLWNKAKMNIISIVIKKIYFYPFYLTHYLEISIIVGKDKKQDFFGTNLWFYGRKIISF